jgi:hypothetical protein
LTSDESKQKVSVEEGLHHNELVNLSDLTQAGSVGIICFEITEISEVETNQGWKFRKLKARDSTMPCAVEIGESQFQSMKIKKNDYLTCRIKSHGVDSEANLTVLIQKELDAREISGMLATQRDKFLKSKEEKRKLKKGPTSWGFHSREARGLIKLIRFYIKEAKPQHYSKLYPNQIVAQELFSLGLAKRVGGGIYIPTEEAKRLVLSHAKFPSNRIRVFDGEGAHMIDSPKASYKTIEEYLEDEVDKEAAIEEYRETLKALEASELDR